MIYRIAYCSPGDKWHSGLSAGDFPPRAPKEKEAEYWTRMVNAVRKANSAIIPADATIIITEA